MSAPPLPCQWDGESFTPAGQRWAREADKHFVIGEVYHIEAREPRSLTSHNHFFACVQNAWENLPEDVAARFPSSDHLRKWCLIRAGFRDERSIACASKAEARRLAAFIEPMDDFAVVVVSEATVSVYTAKSQSMRAMGKVQFQRSKDAVLTELAKLIGTDAAQLARASTEAA